MALRHDADIAAIIYFRYTLRCCCHAMPLFRCLSLFAAAYDVHVTIYTYQRALRLLRAILLLPLFFDATPCHMNSILPELRTLLMFQNVTDR